VVSLFKRHNREKKKTPLLFFIPLSFLSPPFPFSSFFLFPTLTFTTEETNNKVGLLFFFIKKEAKVFFEALVSRVLFFLDSHPWGIL